MSDPWDKYYDLKVAEVALGVERSLRQKAEAGWSATLEAYKKDSEEAARLVGFQKDELVAALARVASLEAAGRKAAEALENLRETYRADSAFSRMPFAEWRDMHASAMRLLDDALSALRAVGLGEK